MEIIYRQFAISLLGNGIFSSFCFSTGDLPSLSLNSNDNQWTLIQDCVSAPAASHPKPKVQYQPWELALIKCCRDSVRPVTEGYVPLLHTRLYRRKNPPPRYCSRFQRTCVQNLKHLVDRNLTKYGARRRASTKATNVPHDSSICQSPVVSQPMQ